MPYANIHQHCQITLNMEMKYLRIWQKVYISSLNNEMRLSKRGGGESYYHGHYLLVAGTLSRVQLGFFFFY